MQVHQDAPSLTPLTVQAAQLMKDISVEGVEVYWRTAEAAEHAAPADAGEWVVVPEVQQPSLPGMAQAPAEQALTPRPGLAEQQQQQQQQALAAKAVRSAGNGKAGSRPGTAAASGQMLQPIPEQEQDQHMQEAPPTHGEDVTPPSAGLSSRQKQTSAWDRLACISQLQPALQSGWR